MTVAPVARRAARVLLLDDSDRLLLLQWRDPERPELGTWWITPGGGLEADETPEQGAARELFEETGLRLEPSALGAPVLSREVEMVLDGVLYLQAEQFYLVRIASHDVVTSGFTALEVANVLECRWWTLEELSATAEEVSPQGLPKLLASLS